MTTDKKIEAIRWWIREALRTKGSYGEELNYAMAGGMLHAWSIDGSIDFETAEELRTEINNARQGIQKEITE